MKRLLLILALFFAGITTAQENYTIGGDTYLLTQQIKGPLTLLWGSIDGEYRYFVQKGDQTLELSNTKEGKKYQEEYKVALGNLTSDHPVATENVKLTVGSLSEFCEEYNRMADANYVSQTQDIRLKTRLGIFGGMSNYAYFVNPGNDLNGQAGVDFEIIDEVKLKRHSIVVQFRQIFSSGKWDMSSTQFSLNYRFKFIKNDRFDIFINTKITDYVYISQNIDDPNGDGDITDAISGSGGEMQVPFALGLGSDIALANGFLTLAWYDMLALGIDDNGNFPIDFSVGYKFQL